MAAEDGASRMTAISAMGGAGVVEVEAVMRPMGAGGAIRARGVMVLGR